MKVGIVTSPLRGEIQYGDAGRWWRDGHRVILCLADGLGHGPEAAFAATEALDHLAARSGASIKTLFTGCDAAIRHTRGVALAVAMIDTDAHRLAFAAIGNIRATLVRERPMLLPGDCGIVGAGLQRLTPCEMHWEDSDLLLMWTDGLPQALPLASMPPHLRHTPDDDARWVTEPFATGGDDAGVLCARLETAA